MPQWIKNIFNKIFHRDEVKKITEGKKSEAKFSIIDKRKEFIQSLENIKNRNDYIIKKEFCQELKSKVNLITNKERIIDGVRLQILDGQDFNLLIHNNMSRVSPYVYNVLMDKYIQAYEKDKIKEFFSVNNKDLDIGIASNDKYISTSFINQDFLGHAVSYNNFSKCNVFYGFENIKPENLINMGTDDLATNVDTGEIYKDSKIMNSKELIENTVGDYNEVVLKDAKPTCIVCFDEINDFSIKKAKELNIPIKYIESEVYALKHLKNIKKISDIYEKNNNKPEDLLELTKKTLQFIKGYSYIIDVLDESVFKEISDNMWNKIKSVSSDIDEKNVLNYKKISDYINENKLNDVQTFNGENYREFYNKEVKDIFESKIAGIEHEKN